MKSVGPLKLAYALLCDDVRAEANSNKHILIGTYSGDIRLGAPTPVASQLALYIVMETPEGEHMLEVRLSGPGDDSGILKAQIRQAAPGAGVISTPRLEILFEKEGTFRVDARYGGEGKWVNLIKKRVSYDPSIVSPLPSEQSPLDAPAS